MNEYVLAVVVGLGLFICFTNWRMGFLLCVIVGCLQDPIRKVIPGEPVYLTSAVLLFVAATCFGALSKGKRFSLRPIHPGITA